MVHQLTEQIKLTVPSLEPIKSFFSFDVSSGGFQEKVKVTLLDIGGNEFTTSFSLVVCGDSFYDTSVCTRALPENATDEEVQVINFAPRIDPQPG